MNFIPDHTNICNDETSIIVSGLKIQEPVTLLTDLFITVTCWIIFYRLKKEAKGPVANLFRYFFLVMGMSTLFGGVFGHALCHLLSIAFKLPGWIMSMFAIMLCERSAIMHSRASMTPAVSRFLAYANIIELLIMLSVTCITLNFFFVEFHAFYGLLIVTGSFELYHYRKTKAASSKWILYSVCISAIAAIVHIGQLSPGKWFNFIDLAHCIMCISAYVMYIGVRKIKP